MLVSFLYLARTFRTPLPRRSNHISATERTRLPSAVHLDLFTADRNVLARCDLHRGSSAYGVLHLGFLLGHALNICLSTRREKTLVSHGVSNAFVGTDSLAYGQGSTSFVSPGCVFSLLGPLFPTRAGGSCATHGDDGVALHLVNGMHDPSSSATLRMC